MEVGDYVARTRGRDDSKYGKIMDEADVVGEWLVASGGHIFVDQEVDLQLWRLAWPVLGSEWLDIDQE